MAARDDMAAYMRARRARQRAEREAAGKTAVASSLVIDAAVPRNALLKASATELATVRAKAVAIGPGAVITKTDGRFDVVTSEAFEARQRTALASVGRSLHPDSIQRGSAPPPAARSRELTAVRPPLQGEIILPPSMIADGGMPARRYPPTASVAEATALIRAFAADQARVNVETARQLAELRQDIAALKQAKAAEAANKATRQELMGAMLGILAWVTGGGRQGH